MKPITVTWDEGLRFTADIRGHRLTVDQPAEQGGGGAGPMPIELVPTSLGTCVALFVKQFLTTRDLDPTGLTVEVTAHGATNPLRLGRFDVRVEIPSGVPERYRDAVRRAAESCTAHHTLTHTPDIALSIVAGASATRQE